MDSSLLMTIEDWIIFTGFWALFVAMPGPNALNCIASASEFGFKKSLVCVAAILSQAALFFNNHYPRTIINNCKYSQNTNDLENHRNCFFSFILELKAW